MTGKKQTIKLKRARGALLRAINAGRIQPPPGYMGPQKAKTGRHGQKEKHSAALSPP
jgi:hypothetical protein